VHSPALRMEAVSCAFRADIADSLAEGNAKIKNPIKRPDLNFEILLFRNYGTTSLFFRQFDEVFVKQWNGFDAFEVIKNPEMLVWRMDRVAV